MHHFKYNHSNWYEILRNWNLVALASKSLIWQWDSGGVCFSTANGHLGPLLLTWFNFNCCILICLLYVSYHISAKKHRGLFRLELALWTRIAVFLYACYMCHIIFLLRNTGVVSPGTGFMNPYCCILICLLYVSYHIFVKKHNTGNRFAWNWLYAPVLRLNKRSSKQCRRRRFETPSRSSWCHYNILLKLNFWFLLLV